MHRSAAAAVLLVLLLAGCAGPTEETPLATRVAPTEAAQEAAEEPVTEEQADEAEESEAPSPAPEGEAASDPVPAATNETKEEFFEGTSERLIDVWTTPLPVREADTNLFTFEADTAFDSWEIVGAVDSIGHNAMVGSYWVRIYDENGFKVFEHPRFQIRALVTGFGTASAAGFPLGFIYDMPAGTYTLAVDGDPGSTSPIRVFVHGWKDAAPPFQVKLLDDSIVGLPELRGQVVLLDLMATWCGPCHDAMADLKHLHRIYEGRLTILSTDVDSGETKEELRQMREEYQSTWLWGFEVANSVSKGYGTGFIPTFAIVGPDGTMLYRAIGQVDLDTAKQIIDRALA